LEEEKTPNPTMGTIKGKLRKRTGSREGKQRLDYRIWDREKRR